VARSDSKVPSSFPQRTKERWLKGHDSFGPNPGIAGNECTGAFGGISCPATHQNTKGQIDSFYPLIAIVKSACTMVSRWFGCAL